MFAVFCDGPFKLVPAWLAAQLPIRSEKVGTKSSVFAFTARMAQV